MLESLGFVLAALLLICAGGALLYGYVVWRAKRRSDDAIAEAGRKSSGGKGEE